ncbi:unnamed protein product [Lactuca saligna]|uniref:USP domain-containing protein n=1 Tax=Lactuca saligna TaxID=75948 RepID=A0AA35V2D2_LACSI|nr:unnamed protein product [Lactuca saligna]
MDRGLYFCVPFREQLLKYYEKVKNPDVEENLLTCLAELFTQISTQKKKTGGIAPKRFVQRVKKENELFRGYTHQFLLNELVDILEKETKGTKEHSSPPEKIPNGIHVPLANGVRKEPLVTWVHKNFQGILTNETKCLRSETVTARDETLLNPSLDIEQNNSITSCLKNFSSTETLNAEDKFFCDKCCSDLDSWLKTPSIYVFDCSVAGMIANAFIEDWTPSSSSLGTSPRDCILLAACEAHEKVMSFLLMSSFLALQLPSRLP